MFSKNCVDNEEKEERLRTALQLCKGAAPNLPLPNICQQFTAAGFYQGVIELCLTCVAKIDPNESAIHYYKSNEPMDYQEGYLAYSARMECYKEVKMMMEQIYQSLCSDTNNLDLIKCGVILDDREKNITNQILTIVNSALQAQDQLLHVAVYEWLLTHNLLGELLGISEPSLGEFLRRSVSRSSDNLKLADLLWKYYERNGQHTAAAKILDKLAGMATDSIPLTQRIEYLARAVMCMRSDAVGYSVHNGELLRELEDKLEIAQVQKQILDTLTNNRPSDIDIGKNQEAIKKLNRNLYEMTQLYEDFADAFGLWECKLTILNCSHHNDPLLIESVWTKILDKELEGTGSPLEKSNRLLSKVQSLASEYGNSGPCFPLAFLIRELELRCFKLRIPSSPVPEALIHMNLDIDSILDIYMRMISMNERVWITDDDELYLIRAIILLLSLLASQTTLIPAKNRRRTIAKTQDLVSASLNLLYTKPDTQSYIDSLRDIQAKLQRIVF
jgi:nuclear pore complex protein Nup155